MRVLLIEDDRSIAQSIELMLKSESFNVYTTDLGEEGVDLGRLYDYDIILLDLNLPDMSGFDVLRSLSVSKVKTPILILSGVASIEHKVKGLGYGADDYMTKPFHKAELIARVRAIVRRSSSLQMRPATTMRKSSSGILPSHRPCWTYRCHRSAGTRRSPGRS
jgi:two-component system, cell cycle response regulator CtrA